MDNIKIVKKAINFAKPYYDLPHRVNGYHSWVHIEEGFDLFKKHFNNESSELGKLVFYLSWIFHDIVYIGSSDKNEEESELVFKLFCSLNSDLINEETQKYISEIIIATKHHRPARVSNNEILDISKKLNDIDLAYLGYDFEIFMKKRELIRIDYIMYNEREFKIGSTLFCSQMQKEDQIYLTKTFNDIYNENFKNNIKKYLEILKS